MNSEFEILRGDGMIIWVYTLPGEVTLTWPYSSSFSYEAFLKGKNLLSRKQTLSFKRSPFEEMIEPIREVNTVLLKLSPLLNGGLTVGM